MSEDPTRYDAAPASVGFPPTNIRYRVWDGERMHYPEDSAADSGTYYLVARDGRAYDNVNGAFEDGPCEWAVPLLSTGLRDNDGREMFEGDHKDCGAHGVGVVTYNRRTGGYVLERTEAARFEGRARLIQWPVATPGRVVGNVYEGIHAEADTEGKP